MDRYTISLDHTLAAAFDQLIAERGYANRSEAVRDLLRAEIERGLQRRHLNAGQAGQAVACLSYVCKPHERELGERLMLLQHGHHDIAVTSSRLLLDHEHSLETLLLRGPAAAVRALADRIGAERGVQHAQLNLISMQSHHEHAHGAHAVPHLHLKPAT